MYSFNASIPFTPYDASTKQVEDVNVLQMQVIVITLNLSQPLFATASAGLSIPWGLTGVMFGEIVPAEVVVIASKFCAQSSAGLSIPWGLTGVMFGEIVPAEVVVIASKFCAQSWLLTEVAPLINTADPKRQRENSDPPDAGTSQAPVISGCVLASSSQQLLSWITWHKAQVPSFEPLPGTIQVLQEVLGPGRLSGGPSLPPAAGNPQPTGPSSPLVRFFA
ncbi:hypothetical protein PAXINDRAFT_153392 [Paxillus involutus ATCC 200175]|nr:hypothetical protein PAXINDRAFT_153392 [Paxillus involutus ATCC 200175]